MSIVNRTEIWYNKFEYHNAKIQSEVEQMDNIKITDENAKKQSVLPNSTAVEEKRRALKSSLIKFGIMGVLLFLMLMFALLTTINM